MATPPSPPCASGCARGPAWRELGRMVYPDPYPDPDHDPDPDPETPTPTLTLTLTLTQ